MNVLLKLGVVLVVGLLGAKIARMFKLPNVTGYLVAGLCLGVSFARVVNALDLDALGVISEVALAIIAFSIGSEFVLKDIRKLGKSVVVITVLEALGAVAAVFAVMYFVFKQPFAFSVVIASMSASTAPAATVLVMRQYRAQGPLTQTILPVVALDDVVGIMCFGLASSVARLSLGDNASVLQMLTQPAVEIFGSLALGAVLGVLLTWLANTAADRDELQGITLGAIAAATGLASYLDLSPLLTCIAMGTVLANLKRNSSRVFGSVNDFAAPVYVLFFALAGASLDMSILRTVGAIGVAYIFARASGKMLGAAVGAKAVKADENVVKYLGLALLPQGGVSIGLAVLVRQILPQYAPAVTTIIMFSVMIYEILGPICAKIAIQKAGEIGGMDKVNQRHVPIVEELVF